VIANTVEQAKAMHYFGCRVPLPLAAFADGGFMQVPIVSAHKLQDILSTMREESQGMPTDTTGIDHMRLLQLERHSCVFGQVAVREMHLRKALFRFLVDAPPHDAHLRRITKSSLLSLNFVFLMRPMNEIMACFAHGNQVIWTIAARLS